jgi:DNA repair exonuclease SbcCD ATPase subunit
MSYKFIHLADIHWRGLSRHKEYRLSFEDAFEKIKLEKPDAIFIVGDIVHSKTQGISPELINCLSWWFKEFNNIAKTYVSLGNHDGLILNKEREDAISPIIKALNLPNITLIKGTQNLKYDNKINITNFCPFDEKKWFDIKPIDKKINIALFHGPVNNSKVDSDWRIESDVGVEFFKNYDFVFLGDIHKEQFIDNHNRIRYCGSTIQQNFGESLNKGFTVWSINDKDSFEAKHVPVYHANPFITIPWKGTVESTLDEAESYPDGSRFRIRTEKLINQTDIKYLFSSLRENKKATEILIKHDPIDYSSNLNLINKTNTNLNLKNPNNVVDLILKFYESNNLTKKTNKNLAEQIKKYCKEISNLNETEQGKWTIKKLEFDNMFGYGKDNTIDFDKLEGIVGIFGQNRIGKSSICGTLMYSLFNSTDRGSLSNLHVINTRKGYCLAKITIGKNGKNYLIERQSVKKENRKGELSAVTNLNLFEIDIKGNKLKDLNGEQRRDTDKTIKNIIGNADDFLLTAFASQGEINNFLQYKATARKNILFRFLELDVFDQLHEVVKKDSMGLRQLIKNIPDKDYKSLILDEKNKLKSKILLRQQYQENFSSLRKNIIELEINLAKSNSNNLITKSDYELEKNNFNKLITDNENLNNDLTNIQVEISELKEKINKIELLKNSFPLEELKKELKQQRELENEVLNFNHTIEKEKQKQKMLQKQVKVLNNIPCGDMFKTCPFIVDAHKAQSSLKSIVKETENLAKELKNIKNKIGKNSSSEIENRIEKYNNLINKQNNFKANLSNLEKSEINIKNKINQLKTKIENYNVKLNEMLANLASDEDSNLLEEFKNKIKKFKIDEFNIENNITKLSEEIGLIQSNIKKLKIDKKKYKEIKEKWEIYDLILQATSKNGIPLELIRKKLPEINEEISQILQGVVDFTVELESDDNSNDMEIYINYGDSKRIIESCSGMEKMISAIAIRVALTNVSQLSKPDIFIIDEGFGALDSNNVESCNKLLESLKKWFKCILIISHVDAIKDVVDNIIEIEKIKSNAKIKQI